MPGQRRTRKQGFYGYLKLAEDAIQSHLDRAARYFRSLSSKQAGYFSFHRRGRVRSLWNRRGQYLHVRPGQVQFARSIRSQPRLVLASYFCGIIGILLSYHDYHHFHAEHFGFSTPMLGAAIVLYLLGMPRHR